MIRSSWTRTFGIAAVATTALTVALGAQQIRTAKQTPFPRNPDWAKLDVETLPVQGQVHLLAGAGGNIAVQVGDEGVTLVDSGYEQMSAKVLAAVRKLSDKPIRNIVNTTLMDSHTGGNAALAREGRINQAGPGLGGRAQGAEVRAHANLAAIMELLTQEKKFQADRQPRKTFSLPQGDFSSNNEPVVMLHVPAAVTDGDVMVWFRKSDVVVTGEIFNQASFPFIDVAHGGTINGILDGLNMLLDITVPRFNQEGGTMVIPGYGRISDENDVLEYRDMLTIIRDRVQASIRKKLTLAQIKAQKPGPTYEYEPRFNRDPGWTAEMFVEAVYRTLGGT